MTGAMYAAVSGLKSHMSALNVIGNNIANVNTNGYKASRYTFLESLYTQVSGGSDGTTQVGGRNPSQLGYGCSLGTVDIDMSTKNYSPTGMATDLMIDGDGFLMVGDKGATSEKSLYLTRVGNLSFDSQGYLVDGQGSCVYGYLQSDNGTDTVASTKLTAIRLPWASATDGTAVYPKTTDGTDLEELASDDASISGRVVLDSIGIDESTGRISGVTADGETVVVGYIALGKVDNPNGVTHISGAYYKASSGAGTLHVCSLGGVIGGVESAGNTGLITGGLESSGTDLATEITNMITVQRGYQSNTRIITVTDSMLEELVNMKR